ncbi:MAG TPA: PfkB family carbohydrate kinase [Terriglobia bacterium]|jgi:D-beta-D-heptose 7-phosphate kinase/D-beta-D-heptose 1-phosphate adenosyltransferase
MAVFEDYIQSFSRKKILVIGDIMLDRFIWGKVSRISPEAPVPVVTVEKEEIYSGGAANVARNLVPFAGEVHIAGQVGRDRDGELLLELLAAGSIDAAGVLSSPRCETITKTRVVARKQQVVRFDREQIRKITNDQVVQVKRFVLGRSPELDGLIISDYGKGFITQELVDAIIPIARAAGLVITVDPNPKNPLKWHGVTAIKPNRAEAFREVGVEEDGWEPHNDPLQDKVLQHVGEELLDRWGTEIVQITLGEQGMLLFERGGNPHYIPTVAREVFDVSGAGDTAIALFTLALTAGASAVEAAEISNYASGVVVGKLGTATLTRDELLASMRDRLMKEAVTS